jgi:hypothetical protein
VVYPTESAIHVPTREAAQGQAPAPAPAPAPARGAVHRGVVQVHLEVALLLLLAGPSQQALLPVAARLKIQGITQTRLN